jgi:hypothetical protein
MLGPYEIAVILGILLLLFFGENPKRLAADLSEALYRLQRGDFHRGPRPDLRGIEWLALAITVLFLELIWLASHR